VVNKLKLRLIAKGCAYLYHAR